MRSLIVILSLFASIASHACVVELYAKKPDSKSFFLKSGDTVSMAQVKKFKAAGCTLKARLLSATELHAIDLKKAEAKLKKLQAGPQQASGWFEL